MTTLSKKCLTACAVSALVVVLPLMVYSFSSNPPLGKTGAPGEGTCSSCHGGGGGAGNIAVSSSGGTTYTPGVKQHLTVTVTDSSANVWGYEMTAIQATKPTQGEGKFKLVDKNSSVRKSGKKQYAAQVNDQSGKSSPVKFLIDWTPPKTNVGNITLYLAGVAGNNNGDTVYSNSLTLTPH